jgi:hypothetical protein
VLGLNHPQRIADHAIQVISFWDAGLYIKAVVIEETAMNAYRPLAFVGLVALLAFDTQASAASAPSAKPSPVAHATVTPAPAAAPTPSPEQARQTLNQAQAEAAQQQVGENYARTDNYAEAVKVRAATIQRQEEAYAASLAQFAAQKAQYEVALGRWRASLPPCRSSRRHPCPAI